MAPAALLVAASLAAAAAAAPPCSADFGDPAAAAKAAAYAATHPEYARFRATLRRGDVVLSTRNDPAHFISAFTRGPFTHVMLCVDAAPPGRFLEAFGATNRGADPTGDQVRWTTAARFAHDRATLRIVRPSRDPAAIDAAIRYAEAQVGKPYNFTFSDRLGGDRAFYCSSLMHRAYVAAGVDWRLDRIPGRNARLVALRQVLLALDLEDPVGVAGRVLAEAHRDPAPDGPALARFVTMEALPRARTLGPWVRTRDQRERLAGAIAAAMGGRPTGLLATLGPAGLARIAARAGGGALDAALDPDFVSPSDLAWARLPHWDFNVQPGRPIGRPKKI